MSNTHLDDVLGFLCFCLFVPGIRRKRRERQIRVGNQRPRGGKPRDIQLRHHHQRGIPVLSPGDLEKSQPQCLLFSKLPAELRNVIWLDCLGGGLKFHLDIWDRRLQQRQCTSTEFEVCWEPGMCARRRLSNELLPARNILSLLLSCRQIYAEVFPILYAKSEFTTTYRDIIEFSSRVFAPQQIRTIRSLNFKWRVIGAAPTSAPGRSSRGDRLRTKIWLTVWKNLSEMDGLEKLRVHLGFWGQSWLDLSAAQVTILFEPALAIKAPKLFELGLPMPQQSDSSPWASLPFQIRWSTPAST